MGKLRPISPYETALLDETLQEFISRREKRYKLSKNYFIYQKTSSNLIVKKRNYMYVIWFFRTLQVTNALSFYVTKTVLVGPKWFWFVQIDLDLTIMIWSQPKWIGQVQMWFILVENHNLDLTNSFWLWPFHFGRDQIIMVKSKSIWSDQNHFGPTKTVLVT